jgi:signal transduction histidine kinase
VKTETLTAGLADNAAPNAKGSPSRVEPFAAFIAHELRNPLAAQCALLELALADPNPARIRLIAVARREGCYRFSGGAHETRTPSEPRDQ